MPVDIDKGSLATIASIIAAFGVAMLFFRIQRELAMVAKGERIWLPAADWLLCGATLVCILLVILPIIFSSNVRLPSAAAGAAAIMVAGYVLAILSHYRIVFGRRFILFGRKRSGPRDNPEPSELFFVLLTLVVASLGFLIRMTR